MHVWEHDGKLFEVSSGYSLPDDAWQYELYGLTGAPLTGPIITVTIPDATPDGGQPFTPQPVDKVLVRASGEIPWPILRRFVEMIESSGDLVYASDDSK